MFAQGKAYFSAAGNDGRASYQDFFRETASSTQYGLTGKWQISERHTSTFAERAVYDDAYEQDLSLGTDLGIIGRTIGVVLRCTGA